MQSTLALPVCLLPTKMRENKTYKTFKADWCKLVPQSNTASCSSGRLEQLQLLQLNFNFLFQPDSVPP